MVSALQNTICKEIIAISHSYAYLLLFCQIHFSGRKYKGIQ